jgi:periplasmic protein TonB
MKAGRFMPVAQIPPTAASGPASPQPSILPTLTGEGCGDYRAHAGVFVLSYLLNLFIGALLVWSGHWVVQHHEQIRQRVVNLVTDVSPYILPPSKTESGGGGGGGDRDKLAASKGSPPKFAKEQLTPPMVVVRNPAPKLPAEPTVIGPPQILLPQTEQMGDPLSTIVAPLSNGSGFGGGIGNGSGGGVGSGHGRGVGPGYTAGIGGGLYHVGGGVTAPRPIYAPDPEYSEEARKAKFQGTVVLWMVVTAEGRAQDIHVMRSAGMGLDERALDAVRTWRFEPARKDGKPVAVQISVEVSFRLY